MKVMRWLKPLAVWTVSLLLLVLILIWFSGGFADRTEPGTVQSEERRWEGEPTARVHRVMEEVVETAVGSIAARERTAIAPQILATIEEVRVRAGDTVEAGDVLVVLDSRDLRSRVAQAEQAVDAARAEWQRASADLERYQELLSQSVVNQSEFDRVQSGARVAQAEQNRAERALEEAEVALSYAEVKAPISGRVVDRLVQPGDTGVPGEPMLTIYNPEALRLEAPVREGLATSLAVGDPLTVRVDTLALVVPGEVEEIVPQAETGSRSFLVKVAIPRAPGLYTGMFGRLLIPAGERERLLLPTQAIERVGQLEYVDVVTEDAAIQRRLVITGAPGEFEQIEVISGLTSGETVLLHD